MKKLRHLYYKLFPTFKEVDVKCVTYMEGDKLIRDSAKLPNKEDKWVLSKMEDTNRNYGYVYLCKKVRVLA